MMPDLTPIYSLLADPNNLVIFFLVALGYILKATPVIKNDYIKVILGVAGMIVCPVFIKPVAVGIVRGLIYAAVSTFLYDIAISRVEGFLKNTLGGVKPTYLQVFIATLSIVALLSGCSSQQIAEAKTDSVDFVKSPVGQTVTQYGEIVAGGGAAYGILQAFPSDERSQVADIGLRLCKALYTLATGSIPDDGEIKGVLLAAKTGNDTQLYNDVVKAALPAVSMLFKSLGTNSEYLTWGIQGLEYGFGIFSK